MKKKVFLSLLLGGFLMFGNAEAAVELDQPIGSINNANSYVNDGYVEIVTTSDGTEYRASSIDHSIKQITYVSDGTTIDGATCGDVFDDTNMTFKPILDWNHGDERYRTYEAPNGEIVMVTTQCNKVISLTEYSKSIANC